MGRYWQYPFCWGRLIQITYTVKNVINIYSGRSEKPFLICISAFGKTKMSALKNSSTFGNIVTSRYWVQLRCLHGNCFFFNVFPTYFIWSRTTNWKEVCRLYNTLCSSLDLLDIIQYHNMIKEEFKYLERGEGAAGQWGRQRRER